MPIEVGGTMVDSKLTSPMASQPMKKQRGGATPASLRMALGRTTDNAKENVMARHRAELRRLEELKQQLQDQVEANKEEPPLTDITAQYMTPSIKTTPAVARRLEFLTTRRKTPHFSETLFTPPPRSSTGSTGDTAPPSTARRDFIRRVREGLGAKTETPTPDTPLSVSSTNTMDLERTYRQTELEKCQALRQIQTLEEQLTQLTHQKLKASFSPQRDTNEDILDSRLATLVALVQAMEQEGKDATLAWARQVVRPTSTLRPRPKREVYSNLERDYATFLQQAARTLSHEYHMENAVWTIRRPYSVMTLMNLPWTLSHQDYAEQARVSQPESLAVVVQADQVHLILGPGEALCYQQDGEWRQAKENEIRDQWEPYIRQAWRVRDQYCQQLTSMALALAQPPKTANKAPTKEPSLSQHDTETHGSGEGLGGVIAATFRMLFAWVLWLLIGLPLTFVRTTTLAVVVIGLLSLLHSHYAIPQPISL